MIKIEFPADRPDIARAVSDALRTIGRTWLAETDAQPASEIDAVKPDAQPGPECIEKSEDTPSGVNAAGAFGTAPPAETDSASPSASSARVDERGVPFDAAYCGTAEKPFYASGKMAGQWKKLRGVDQAAYDRWYAGELEQLGPPTATATVNPGAAFGASQPAADEPTPKDAGELMLWVSEQQAAGLLTQDDVNDAYRVTGVSTASLFGPNASRSVADIHTYLLAQVSR